MGQAPAPGLTIVTAMFTTSSHRKKQKKKLIAAGWSHADAEAGAIATFPMAKNPGNRQLEEAIREESQHVAMSLNPNSDLSESEKKKAVRDALKGYSFNAGFVGNRAYGEQYLEALNSMSDEDSPQG